MKKILFPLNLTNCLNRKHLEYKDFVFLNFYSSGSFQSSINIYYNI